MGTVTSKNRRRHDDIDRETLLTRPYRRDDYPSYDGTSRWRSTLVQGAFCAAFIAAIIVGTGSLAVPYAQSHLPRSRAASSKSRASQPIAVGNQHAHTASPQLGAHTPLTFEPAGATPLIDGYAVAAACRNRHESLRRALPTWLALRGLSEIVLVDWASTPPLAE
eukprot:IDg18438t1